MASVCKSWIKFRKWCRLIILIHKGGESVCRNILSKMDVKDITDGTEIYKKLKPYVEIITRMAFYQQKVLLPDNEVIDTTKINISLSTRIIEILDTTLSYPQVEDLRDTRNELFYMSNNERDMTEEQFNNYWENISQLLTSLHFNMSLMMDLKAENHLNHKYDKLLKDIKGRIKLFL